VRPYHKCSGYERAERLQSKHNDFAKYINDEDLRDALEPVLDKIFTLYCLYNKIYLSSKAELEQMINEGAVSPEDSNAFMCSNLINSTYNLLALNPFTPSAIIYELFVLLLRDYMSIICNWLEKGEIIDITKQFFIKMNPLQLQEGNPIKAWTEFIQVKKTKNNVLAPSIFSKVLNLLINSGKTAHLLLYLSDKNSVNNVIDLKRERNCLRAL
jgi:hypothetical protein